MKKLLSLLFSYQFLFLLSFAQPCFPDGITHSNDINRQDSHYSSEREVVLQILSLTDSCYLVSGGNKSNFSTREFIRNNDKHDTWLYQIRNPIQIFIPQDYPTIQQGIDSAKDGDIIIVDEGTYNESFDFRGKNITIIASKFLETGETVDIHSTIIDAGEEGSVVVFKNGENSNAKLIGFKIQNGHAINGGGIHITNSSPTLENLIILDNTVTQNGGGIYCNNANPIISNSAIYSNSTDLSVGKGGGIFTYSSNPIIDKIWMTNNKARYGGGICFDSLSGPVIRNSGILYNEAGNGGGIFSRHSQPTFVNTSISHNWSSNDGGGIAIIESNAFILNSTICDNWCYGSGTAGGVYNENGDLSIMNTILWSNHPDEIKGFADVNYSTITGGFAGTGNIDQDPMFDDDSGGFGYHLLYTSPCIDAGKPDTTGLNLPEFDMAGEIRIFNERIDMGAYEWNTTVGIDDGSISETSQLQVATYPNPFYASTTIEYYLNQPSDVTLTIYNHLGKKVDLISQHQQAGKQSLTWQPKGIPPGMYYFTLQAGDQVSTGKMVMGR